MSFFLTCSKFIGVAWLASIMFVFAWNAYLSDLSPEFLDEGSTNMRSNVSQKVTWPTTTKFKLQEYLSNLKSNKIPMKFVRLLSSYGSCNQLRFFWRRKKFQFCSKHNDMRAISISISNTLDRFNNTDLWKFVAENRGRVQFVDLNCGNGIYSVVASRHSAVVIAISPVRETLEDILKTVQIEKVNAYVIAIQGVVTDNTDNHTIQNGTLMKVTHGTIPGLFLDDVARLLIGDLIVIIRFNILEPFQVLLYGNRIFEVAQRFLYIYMDTVSGLGITEMEQIVTYFHTKGFLPYPNFHSRKRLYLSNHQNWPFIIVWKSKGRYKR